MTDRHEEAVELAAQELCHQLLGPQPLASINPMTADSFRQDAGRIITAYEAHMRPLVDILQDLPPGTVVEDQHGDVGVVVASRIHYPETAPLNLAYASKHYGPFTILHWGDR